MRRLFARVLVCGAFALAFAAGDSGAQQAADALQPERATPLADIWVDVPGVAEALAAKGAGRPVRAQTWMISVANPHAAAAGAAVLRQGGSAADAMVAAQVVLGLVEPQSSGLGGGAFLVWYDAASGALTTLDGRETAPMGASPRLFQDESGAPLGFFDAVLSARSVGVPGVPALMEAAHGRWGRLDWAPLMEAGITLAEDGFAVSPRLAALVARDAERLAVFPQTADYFLPGGAPLAAGQRLRNPAYAETLRALARDGAGVFYALKGGAVAPAILEAVAAAGPEGAGLSAWDLAFYQVVERAPVCVAYRGHDVCGMGPPSSGALAVGQTLGVLSHFDLPAMGPGSLKARRLIGDASRLAFADRGRYVADSDFVPVPVQGMLAPDYLAARAALLRGGRALADAPVGTPEFDHALIWADHVGMPRPSTTHISIVDSFGNALAMTSSIENAFGSRIMAGGFLLNNQLTDFSFRSHRDGVPVANRAAPGKRPRSSMSPTIVLKDGAPVLVIGSPGGSRIISYVTNAIIAHLDWGMDVQKAVSMGHAVNRFGRYDLEEGTGVAALADPLAVLGFEVRVDGLNSGLQAIALRDGALFGGADPRREGIALGE